MVRILRVGLLLAAWLVAGVANAAQLRIYFFDIGQGDSALIVSPTGKTVLIDAGPPEGGAKLHQRLEELLKGPIDLAILSHPHLDHLGGMEQALSAKGALLFMDSGFSHPSPPYSKLMQFLEGHNIKVVNATQGRNIDLGGGATLTILAPPSPFLTGTRSDPNANSVVARLSYGKKRVLFVGDAEEDTEKVLLEKGDLATDVLKVAHHGSRHSSTQEFLDAAKPKIAVISVGAGNDYGHPTRAALDRLEGIGAKIYRTDLDGEVRVVTDGETINAFSGPESAAERVADVEKPAAKPGKLPKNKTIIVQASDRVPDAPPEHGSHKAHADNAKPASANPSDAPFVGSSHSKVFHKAGCHGAKQIEPKNLVGWTSRDAAVSAGREPAKDCNP